MQTRTGRKIGIGLLVLAALLVTVAVVGAQGPRGGMMGGFGPEDSLLAIAAEQLGMEPTELVAELQAGKTIAELAEAQGVAVDTLVDAVLAAHSEWLTQAVTAGNLTQEQADARLALMKTNLT